ncbi:MAG: hypothetical protein IPL71_00605 [Anaerolineales bacterium]|uniref:hypothetical protein n=1 Tax=Candidatus Villigracilis proximus TaxID=3140683 RepID=UPI003136E9B7|nr:hypothetical protein [Anaerolineales bacterium]
MNLLLDGWLVVFNNWSILAWILLVIFLGYTITLSVLKIIFKDTLTAAEYFSFGLAGSLLPFLFGSLFIFSLNHFQRTDLSLLIPLALLSLALMFLQRKAQIQPAQGSRSTLTVLILIFCVSIFLRLVFISEAITPLYFDSAEHYRIIRYLLGIYRNSQSILQTSLPDSRYYHLGFHLMTAALPSSVQWYVMDSMMIFGQIILAMIPIPVFFIVRHETSSDKAGLLAVLLASFGWYMPAYAVNWGKYPALTSLIILQFVLNIGYATFRFNLSPSTQWKKYILPGLGIAAAGLIHTRSVLVIGIVFAAWIIAKWWLNSPKWIQLLLLFLTLGGFLAEYFLIQSSDVLKVVFDPYIQSGYVMTSLAVLLSMAAYKTFPRLTLSSLLVILFLLASLFIPVNILSARYGYQTILDRPFVEMLLYLPLSLLGGLGFAGVEQYFHSREQEPGAFNKAAGGVISLFLLGFIFLYSFTNYNFRPSDCCKIVSSDDLIAFDWIKRNLPIDTQILIATTELNVFTSTSSEGFTGTDAGIWIPSLAGRPIFGAPYALNFGEQSTLDMLCEQEVNYVYIGGTPQSFHWTQLNETPDWYKNVFSLPKTQIYRITGCAAD